MVKVLVTGGAGFIGSHTVAELVKQCHVVTIVDNLVTGTKNNLHPAAQCFIDDILDEPRLDHIFQSEQPEAVIHLAAQIDVAASQRDPSYDAQNNILGTITVLEKCRKYKVNKIVFSSSAAVYGTPMGLPVDEDHPLMPLSFYGFSKLTAEQYIRKYCDEFGINFTILRYSNVYGPGQKLEGECGVVSIFYHLMKQGKKPVIYGDGLQTRDFVYVKDVAAANVVAMQSDKNEVFNIGTGQSITVRALYEMMSKMMGHSMSALYGSTRPGDIKDSCLRIEKAEQLLMWKPNYDISQGLSELCQQP